MNSMKKDASADFLSWEYVLGIPQCEWVYFSSLFAVWSVVMIKSVILWNNYAHHQTPQSYAKTYVLTRFSDSTVAATAEFTSSHVFYITHRNSPRGGPILGHSKHVKTRSKTAFVLHICILCKTTPKQCTQQWKHTKIQHSHADWCRIFALYAHVLLISRGWRRRRRRVTRRRKIKPKSENTHDTRDQF